MTNNNSNPTKMLVWLLTVAAASVAQAQDFPTFAPTAESIYGLCFYDSECLFACGDAITADDCIGYEGVLQGLRRQLGLSAEVPDLTPRLRRILERDERINGGGDDYLGNSKAAATTTTTTSQDRDRRLQEQLPMNIPYFKSASALAETGIGPDQCVQTSSDPQPVGKCCPNCEVTDTDQCSVTYYNPEGCSQLPGFNYFWDVITERLTGSSDGTCTYMPPPPTEPPTGSPTETVFCTADVMECPDGSFVARSPPDCEFDACPPDDDTESPTGSPTVDDDDDDDDDDCPVLGCCADDCCAQGTRWEDPFCVVDPSSPGFFGVFPPAHEYGCVIRSCCEGDCCGDGTVYDAFEASCVLVPVP